MACLPITAAASLSAACTRHLYRLHLHTWLQSLIPPWFVSAPFSPCPLPSLTQPLCLPLSCLPNLHPVLPLLQPPPSGIRYNAAPFGFGPRTKPNPIPSPPRSPHPWPQLGRCPPEAGGAGALERGLHATQRTGATGALTGGSRPILFTLSMGNMKVNVSGVKAMWVRAYVWDRHKSPGWWQPSPWQRAT